MKVGATQKEEFGSKRISPKTKISYPEKPFQENSKKNILEVDLNFTRARI